MPERVRQAAGGEGSGEDENVRAQVARKAQEAEQEWHREEARQNAVIDLRERQRRGNPSGEWKFTELKNASGMVEGWAAYFNGRVIGMMVLRGDGLEPALLAGGTSSYERNQMMAQEYNRRRAVAEARGEPLPPRPNYDDNNAPTTGDIVDAFMKHTSSPSVKGLGALCKCPRVSRRK